jgi:hypothetical protein
MRLPVPLGVAALALLLTACSSPAKPAPPAKPAATPPASPSANPDAGLLTGTQLKALLAPASWFPSGFTLDPKGSADTGDNYQAPTPPSQQACTALNGVSWVQLGGGGAVSFAQNDYLDTSLGQYAQEIDVFQGATAQNVMATLRSLPSSCKTFQDPQTSSTVNVTLSTGPQLGDDSLTITLQDPRWGGDLTLEAVRVGTAVVTVYFSAASGTSQTQATSLATAVTANLKKAG